MVKQWLKTSHADHLNKKNQQHLLDSLLLPRHVQVRETYVINTVWACCVFHISSFPFFIKAECGSHWEKYLYITADVVLCLHRWANVFILEALCTTNVFNHEFIPKLMFSFPTGKSSVGCDKFWLHSMHLWNADPPSEPMHLWGTDRLRYLCQSRMRCAVLIKMCKLTKVKMQYWRSCGSSWEAEGEPTAVQKFYSPTAVEWQWEKWEYESYTNPSLSPSPPLPAHPTPTPAHVAGLRRSWLIHSQPSLKPAFVIQMKLCYLRDHPSSHYSAVTYFIALAARAPFIKMLQSLSMCRGRLMHTHTRAPMHTSSIPHLDALYIWMSWEWLLGFGV